VAAAAVDQSMLRVPSSTPRGLCPTNIVTLLAASQPHQQSSIQLNAQHNHLYAVIITRSLHHHATLAALVLLAEERARVRCATGSAVSACCARSLERVRIATGVLSACGGLGRRMDMVSVDVGRLDQREEWW